MKKALVVGINKYRSSPLKGCIRDAVSIGDVLETHGDGSPNFEVKRELDVPAKSDLTSLIATLFSGEGDIALFYFSGHGYVNELGGYIVTPDFTKYDEGVSMEDILKLANKSRIKDKIIILDCCHSGAMGSPGIADGASHLKAGISILTASRDDESALEINGHGVFTSLLLEALRGGSADLRGHISPGSVYAYIDQALGAWQQRPVFKTNVQRFTSLRMVTPPVPPATLRKIIEYFPAPQDEMQLAPSFEYTNTTKTEHTVVAPYAKAEHVAIFKHLQKFQSVGLVVPVGEEHMYLAAMNGKSCRLTALGYHYWKLVKEKRI
jgi:hypothetical protein